MAKYNKNSSNKKVDKPKYPSAYGSHKSMVADKFQEFNDLDNKLVVCEDDKGFYITATNKLDSGAMDTSRVNSIMKRTQIMERYDLIPDEVPTDG